MRQVTIFVAVLLLGGTWQLSRADEARPAPEQCPPAIARTNADAVGYFIASDKLSVLKEARSFAYRVATEKVLRQLERAKLVCRKGCVGGEVEVTTGVDDSRPCRHGVLGKRARKRDREAWHRACLNSLDYAKQCDDARVKAEKPAWAECELAMWGKKTMDCKCRR